MDAKEIMLNVTEYYKIMDKAEKTNYENSKRVLEDLLYTHASALSIFHKLITSKLGKEGITDQKISDKLMQIAVFYQGISTCERTIRNAQYNLAAALVRQEYEIICNVKEIESGTQRSGKAPNAKSGLNNFGKHIRSSMIKFKIIGDLLCLQSLIKKKTTVLSVPKKACCRLEIYLMIDVL